MDFNEKQLEIIDNITGAYLISAPVGTGKTTVLTERIVRAIETGIKPSEILCLTFTNRAAEEILTKIRSRIKDKDVVKELKVSTFHGFCLKFIKAEAKEVGIYPDFIVFDESEQIELTKNILEDFPNIEINEKFAKRETLSLIDKLYKRRLANSQISIGCTTDKNTEDKDLDEINKKYIKELENQNALDFNELVLVTIKNLYTNKKLQLKWSRKFKLIQLDEFQDTHLSEYLVMKELAKKHKNIALIGDLDQTIYSWRGSEPFFIAKLFKSHFKPVKELNLEINYRFDKNILEAIKSFLESFEKKATMKIESGSDSSESDEKCINIFEGYNFTEEISWVADSVESIKKNNPETKIAVLTRANYVIGKIAEIFSDKGLEHVTVDKYDFFRRAEVKDIFAYLKILFNKYDLESAYRIISRPKRNIGDTTIKNIRTKGRDAGIKVSDFLDFKNYNFPEPYANVIKKWDKGRIIVLDTETTGTNPLKDEIIQIYAIEVVNGVPGSDFHFFMKNTIPVGTSEDIHGISDEYLKEKGRNAKEVLNELKDFIAGDATVGHNVNFDLSMIVENGKRHEVIFDFNEYYDTLDLARRLITSPSYKLNTLATMFGLSTATHDAKDDVLATVGLLEVLIGKLKVNSEKRIQLFAKYSKKFIKLSAEIKSWKKQVYTMRPDVALTFIWQESGLAEYYAKDKDHAKRAKSIDTLIKIFKERDDNSKPGDIALRELINYATLTRDINFLGLDKGKVPIVTVHQVKGLEFDHVFIVGMNEYKFPIKMPGSNLEEERRLFYVAMTRARKKIHVSYSKMNDYGRDIEKSTFIDCINPKYINKI
jgi:DNA helicase II / ATP-dependent DNA helicase PcrA